MKNPSLTLRHPLSLLAFAATAAAGFALLPSAASAQTSTDTKTITGLFKFSDGNKGTYVTTITKTGDTTSEMTVFTRSSDQATSTDTTNTTENSDGTRVVVHTQSDFGATAQFSSSKTVTPQKHGEASSTGTYTTATGAGGSLTTLETKIGRIIAADETFTDSTGTTRDLHLKDSEAEFTLDKIITLAADGSVSTAVHTRYITSVK